MIDDINEVEDLDNLNQSDAIIKYEFETKQRQYSLEFFVAKLQKEDIIVPDFQRNSIWSDLQKSLLILSLIKGIPIPSIYLFNDGTKLVIIDGLQRSTAIREFIEGKFQLCFNNPDNEYQGKKIDDLSYLKDKELEFTMISQKTPSGNHEGQYEIFKILNQTTSHLNKQEIRNCIYRGELNNCVKNELNKNSDWRFVYGNKELAGRFEDIELILRCFVVSNIEFVLAEFDWKKTRFSLEYAINKFMEYYNENFDDFKEIKNNFLTTCKKLQSLEINLIQKLTRFDAIFSAFLMANKQNISFPANKDEFENKLKILNDTEGWKKAVSSGTGGETRIKNRVKIAFEILFENK